MKIYQSADAALDDITFDGMTIMSGGFGLSGNPEHLIAVLLRAGTRDLTVISNNCGADGFGLWTLLDPDTVHTPGIYVDRVVQGPAYGPGRRRRIEVDRYARVQHG